MALGWHHGLQHNRRTRSRPSRTNPEPLLFFNRPSRIQRVSIDSETLRSNRGTGIQDSVCAFVREIISARTGEAVELTGRPELVHRRIQAVEELWESPSCRYAVEHTRLESYDGQIENEARLRQLIVPVRELLEGHLPGTFVLTGLVREMRDARIKYAEAHQEIVRLTLGAVPDLKDGETVVLTSERLPFGVQLHRRHGNGSQAFVHCIIDGDGDALRLERIRRAFNEKCPKLTAWATDGRVSVLVLEADDIQLSNVSVVWHAVKQVIADRTGVPDLIVFVETDGGPMYGWVFKDGEYTGDDVPMPNGRRCYTEGEVRS